MPLSILTSTYCRSDTQAKGSVFCYFPLNSKDLKSFDMQTIYAIMWTTFPVLIMARSLSFWDRHIDPKIALTTDSHKSIF
jgi:hypothetical protein